MHTTNPPAFVVDPARCSLAEAPNGEAVARATRGPRGPKSYRSQPQGRRLPRHPPCGHRQGPGRRFDRLRFPGRDRWGLGGNLADGGGPASGGAIGDLSLIEDLQIQSCTFTSSQVLGGRGAGGASIVGGAGGTVRGGSLALLNNIVGGGASGQVAGLMTVDVMDVIAQGGRGGDGYAGNRGGNVDGGGIYIAAGPDNPQGWVVASFSGGQILNDIAQGGRGGGNLVGS